MKYTKSLLSNSIESKHLFGEAIIIKRNKQSLKDLDNKQHYVETTNAIGDQLINLDTDCQCTSFARRCFHELDNVHNDCLNLTIIESQKSVVSLLSRTVMFF